jgi:hypothetical protein
VATSDATKSIRLFLKREVFKSKRAGYWFRLGKQERSLFNLAIRLNIKFESLSLIRALVSVLKKLKQLGDTAYLRIVQGAKLAWAFSEAAVSWGNVGARSWRNDRGYIDFLGKLFYGDSRMQHW